MSGRAVHVARYSNADRTAPRDKRSRWRWVHTAEELSKLPPCGQGTLEVSLSTPDLHSKLSTDYSWRTP